MTYPIYRELGKRIYEARTEMEISQSDLAKKVGKHGVSAVSVSLWESGKRGMSVMRAKEVANALDMTIEELVEGL